MVIDADGHVLEPDEELVDYLPHPLPHRGARTRFFPFFPTLDGWQRDFQAKGTQRTTTAEDWTHFLDSHQIDCAVLYPTAGLTVGLIQDPDWATEISRAYNAWFQDRLAKNQRLFGVALIPVQNPEAAAAELRYAVERLGFKAGLLPAVTMLGRYYGDAFFNPIYQTAQDLGVPLAVHGAPSQGMGLEAFGRFAEVHAMEHPLAIFKQFTHMICEGVTERYPTLKLAFLEAGAGWVPYLMDRLDEEFERSYGRRLPIRRKPSEIIACGRVWVTGEVEEKTLPLVLRSIGSTQVMWPSDFPHERQYEQFSGDIPALIAREDLTEAEKSRILGGNAAEFYGLGHPGA